MTRKMRWNKIKLRKGAADIALHAAQEQLAHIQGELEPVVNETVRKNKRLLQENHLSDRVYLAYLGEA